MGREYELARDENQLYLNDERGRGGGDSLGFFVSANWLGLLSVIKRTRSCRGEGGKWCLHG